ncbi:hypothetical protein ACFL2Z_04415 [Candidatus Eisenbacteria bacterium]|uniref:Glycosyltransferase RgtA/B/C/D-like domain-containing protein n=1 Tax=Eiseniibacteriota bacterium TaxID=2212470 RepID=A0ABV6YQE9_UNCEI
MMEHRRQHNTVFLVIAAVFCLYAALFIYRTSFVIEGERYFSLFDDAMISMRYARNLASGHGLVWNPGGDRMEGYTNLLWTLYMAAMHLVPVAQSKASLLVQISSALLLLANLIFVRKLSRAIARDSGFIETGALLLTAFYLPLNGWSLQGMEVGLLALLLTAAAWKAVSALKEDGFSPWPYVLLAVGMLVRLDASVPFLAVLLLMVLKDPARRKRHLVYGISIFAVALIAQTLFRVLYYGEFLPNSYYLKITGFPFIFRITRGLYVTFVSVWRMNWVLFLVGFVLLLKPRRLEHSILLALFVAQLAYSIYVGGDAWESWGGANRYVSIVMPCFFVAYMCGLDRIGVWIRARIPESRPDLSPARIGRIARLAKVEILVLSFISFNAIYGPAALTELILLKPTLHVDKNETMVERALAVRRMTRDDASIAVVWDGAIPYFADRHTVSILGKNDRLIARGKMRVPSGPEKLVAFYPGHLKWDYAHSIGRLKPDVVVQLWHAREEASSFLAVNYVPAEVGAFTFYLRRGSPRVLWDKTD